MSNPSTVVTSRPVVQPSATLLLLAGVCEDAAKTIDAALTSAHWHIGWRIVEFEMSGEERAMDGFAMDRTRQAMEMRGWMNSDAGGNGRTVKAESSGG